MIIGRIRRRKRFICSTPEFDYLNRLDKFSQYCSANLQDKSTSANYLKIVESEFRISQNFPMRMSCDTYYFRI